MKIRAGLCQRKGCDEHNYCEIDGCRLDHESHNDERALSFKGQGDPRFFKILHEMAEVHVKKVADYGSDEDPLANLRASAGFGIPAWVGAVVRLNDKMIRLQAFARKGALANESARDSLLDAAAYAILAMILYDEESNA